MTGPASADFGLEQILTDAYEAFKAHFGLILGTFVVFAVIQAAAGKLPLLSLFVGLALLVVPGIFLGLMWSQTLFLLADDIKEVEAGRKDKASLSGWGAMQRSAVLMNGHKLRFLGYAIVLAVIGVSGAIAVGIGILITLPFAWLGGAAFYNRLSRPA